MLVPAAVAVQWSHNLQLIGWSRTLAEMVANQISIGPAGYSSTSTGMPPLVAIVTEPISTFRLMGCSRTLATRDVSEKTNGTWKYWRKCAPNVICHQLGPTDRPGPTSQVPPRPAPRGRSESFTQFFPGFSSHRIRRQFRRSSATRYRTGFVACMRPNGRNEDLPCPFLGEFFFEHITDRYQGTFPHVGRGV